METPPVATQQRVVRLLTALVALTAVLVVSLGVGAALAWREYARLRSASQAALGNRDAGAVVDELSARQQRAVDRLDAMSRDAKRQIAVFERRAADIRAKDGGPIDSAAKALDIASLMMDQSLLALKLTTAIQEAIVKGALPLEPGAAEGDAVVRDEANGREEDPAPRSARRPPSVVPRGEREK